MTALCQQVYCQTSLLGHPRVSRSLQWQTDVPNLGSKVCRIAFKIRVVATGNFIVVDEQAAHQSWQDDLNGTFSVHDCEGRSHPVEGRKGQDYNLSPERCVEDPDVHLEPGRVQGQTLTPLGLCFQRQEEP